MENNKILDTIHNSYLIKNIFNFIDIKKKLQILKYNKKYQNIINISLQDYKFFSSNIKLISKENEIFFIDKKAAKKSQLLKDCMDDDEDFKELNLINVNSKYLKLIIEFLEHYKDSEPKIPPKPLNDKFEKLVDEWTKNFFSKLVLDEIYSLTLSSNFMDIKCLLDLCCSYISDSIRGKTPEEIRIMFHINDDFTEEEENLIRNEQWNMDDL